MKKSLSIEENKTFDKVRNKRWYLPLLFYIMCFICLVGIVISMLRMMITVPLLEPKDSFYIGGDVLGMGICTDVCFGTLITYLIYSVISTAFMKAAKS